MEHDREVDKWYKKINVRYWKNPSYWNGKEEKYFWNSHENSLSRVVTLNATKNITL